MVSKYIKKIHKKIIVGISLTLFNNNDQQEREKIGVYDCQQGVAMYKIYLNHKIKIFSTKMFNFRIFSKSIQSILLLRTTFVSVFWVFMAD